VLGGSLVVGDSRARSLDGARIAWPGDHAARIHALLPQRSRRQARRDSSFGRFDAACPSCHDRRRHAHATSGRRAGDVLVYGVDGRFWAFNGVPSPGPQKPAMPASEARDEIQAGAGDAVLVRLPPVRHPRQLGLRAPGRSARALRLTVQSVLPIQAR
jgi:hypothetical protein